MRSALKKHWRLFLGIGCGWLLVVVSSALNYYLFRDVYAGLTEEPSPFTGLLQVETVYWAVWCLFAPAIFRLTTLVPLRRDRLTRALAIHLPVGALTSLVHRALYLFLFWLVFLVPFRPAGPMGHMLSSLYRHLLLFNLPTGFMTYWTLVLVSHAINTFRRLREEELNATRLKAELAEAQLAALKLQLQPHFLFNTLNSISALLDSNVEAADRMLACLGDFLRMTLDSSAARDVPLEQEMRFVTCYLDIERVRFHDRLRVEFDVDPLALSARVPNLILQPIVENAVKHGIARRLATGRITIRAKRAGETLQLQVCDDGPGLTGCGEGARWKEGVGLGNTRARLRHQYGDAHRLDLRDGPGGGLQVTLEFPYVAAIASP